MKVFIRNSDHTFLKDYQFHQDTEPASCGIYSGVHVEDTSFYLYASMHLPTGSFTLDDVGGQVKKLTINQDTIRANAHAVPCPPQSSPAPAPAPAPAPSYVNTENAELQRMVDMYKADPSLAVARSIISHIMNDGWDNSDVTDMITHKLPLSEAGKGFKLVAEAKNSMKVIIEPNK